MRAALRTGLAAALAATVAFGGVVPAKAAEPADVVVDNQAISAELIDSDGDGIPDLWERNGVVLEDGTVLNLPAYGADPSRPDLFLQLNWMESEYKTLGCDVEPSEACANANTKEYGVKAESLQEMVDLFDDHGINLHVDAGETFNNIPGYEARGGETLKYVKNYFENESQGSKLLNNIDEMLGERQNIFRIGVIGDQIDAYNLSSGASLVNDTSFFVANHRFMNSEEMLRNTILHELGHTLGLRHQGAHAVVKDIQGMRLDTSAYKSVMNYDYQFDYFNYSEKPYLLDTPFGVREVPADWEALAINAWRIGARGVASAPSQEGAVNDPAPKEQPEEEQPAEQPAPEAEKPAENQPEKPAEKPAEHEQQAEQKDQPAPGVEKDVNVAAIVAPIVAILALIGIGFAVMNMMPGLGF